MDIVKLLNIKSPKPQELPRRGTGSLHDEQQWCYDKGFREGVAAFRKALKERVAKSGG